MCQQSLSSGQRYRIVLGKLWYGMLFSIWQAVNQNVFTPNQRNLIFCYLVFLNRAII